MGQTLKSGWAKKLDGPINWVSWTLKWVGQCPAGPSVAPPLVHPPPPPHAIKQKLMIRLYKKSLNKIILMSINHNSLQCQLKKALSLQCNFSFMPILNFARLVSLTICHNMSYMTFWYYYNIGLRCVCENKVICLIIVTFANNKSVSNC